MIHYFNLHDNREDAKVESLDLPLNVVEAAGSGIQTNDSFDELANPLYR